MRPDPIDGRNPWTGPQLAREALKRLIAVRQSWIGLTRSTGPTDRQQAAEGIARLYASLGAAPPKDIVWCGSPLHAARESASAHEQGSGGVRMPLATVLGRTFDRATSGLPLAVRSVVREELVGRVRAWASPVGRVLEAELRSPELPQPVREARPTFHGAQEAGELAAAALLLELGLLSRADPLVATLEAFAQLARSAGWIHTYGRLCIVAERPSRLLLDDVGRPHAGGGPAIVFPDGFAVHAWRGERLPPEWIEAPEKLDVRQIAAIPNVEVRRMLIERVGYERFLSGAGARLVDAGDVGELYRYTFEDDVPLCVVSVENSTPEPDGSRRRYMLRVPPEVRTAREAVAWTFGMRADEYLLDAES